MRSAVGGVILALVLFAVGFASWREARMTRQVADAHRRLATLHYDAEDGIDESLSVWSRLPLPVGSVSDDVRRYRATVSYWLSRFEPLTELTQATGAQQVND